MTPPPPPPPFAYVIHWDALKVRDPNVASLVETLGAASRQLSPGSSGAVRVVTLPNPDGGHLDEVRKHLAADAPSLPPVSGRLTDQEHAALRGVMNGTLMLRQVSNALKHHAALRDIAGGDDREWRVVVEDDAISGHASNTDEMLVKALRGAPAGADIVMLGLPSVQPAAGGEATDGTDAGYPPLSKHFPSLPHCDSYAVRVGVARRLADAFLPVRFPTQMHLWWLARTLSLDIHIASPNVFFDGSKYGVFMSSVDVNNRLWLNPQYCELEAALRAAKEAASCGGKLQQEAAVALVMAAAERVQFRNHPDVQHLLAKAEAARGRPREALAIYGEAMAMFTREGSPMNEHSVFLRDHIAVYGLLQS